MGHFLKMLLFCSLAILSHHFVFSKPAAHIPGSAMENNHFPTRGSQDPQNTHQPAGSKSTWSRSSGGYKKSGSDGAFSTWEGADHVEMEEGNVWETFGEQQHSSEGSGHTTHQNHVLGGLDNITGVLEAVNEGPGEVEGLTGGLTISLHGEEGLVEGLMEGGGLDSLLQRDGVVGGLLGTVLGPCGPFGDILAGAPLDSILGKDGILCGIMENSLLGSLLDNGGPLGQFINALGGGLLDGGLTGVLGAVHVRLPSVTITPTAVPNQYVLHVESEISIEEVGDARLTVEVPNFKIEIDFDVTFSTAAAAAAAASDSGKRSLEIDSCQAMSERMKVTGIIVLDAAAVDALNGVLCPLFDTAIGLADAIVGLAGGLVPLELLGGGGDA